MRLLFQPAAIYHQPFSGEVIVIAPEYIPTVDFYIGSRLHPGLSIHRCYGDDFDATTLTKMQMGAFVVIVRHASNIVLERLYRHRGSWSGVAFLMDDDIPSAWYCRDIPSDYAFRTASRYFKIRRQLAMICDRIWVSTATLKKRYHYIDTTLVPPMPFGKTRQVAARGCRRWAYHGTRIHEREMRWLVPIVKAVNTAVPDAEFELFGNEQIAKLFKGVPGVVVREPLSWPDYLDYCAGSEVAVALAPMLKGRYNGSRSHTKAFDIARCGAVGLFSKSAAYNHLGDIATLLVNNPEVWVNAVVQLLTDDALRLKQYLRFEQWQLLQADKLETLVSPKNLRFID